MAQSKSRVKKSGTVLVLPVPRDKRAKSDKSETPDTRSRSWCFTIPYNEHDILKLQSIDNCDRIVVGREVGEGGYKHIQGYIRFKQPQRFSWWKNHFPQAHVEERKGKEYQATEYCKKDGDVLIDIGSDYDEPNKSMNRNDEAIQIIQEIEKGLTYGEIRQRHKLFCFWNRNHVLKYVQDEKWFKEKNNSDPDF